MYTPTIQVSGSAVFSKLDLYQGYHQLELKPSSRYITGFSSQPGPLEIQASELRDFLGGRNLLEDHTSGDQPHAVPPTLSEGETVGTLNTDDSSDDDDDDNAPAQQQPAPQIAPQLPTPPAVSTQLQLDVWVQFGSSSGLSSNKILQQLNCRTHRESISRKTRTLNDIAY